MLVLCFFATRVGVLEIKIGQTNKQTNRPTDYHNPSAHARRGLIILLNHNDMLHLYVHVIHESEKRVIFQFPFRIHS